MTRPDGRAWVSEHGDRWAVDHEVLRTVVGSTVHGLAVGGTDDRDEMGVYAEPLERVLGVREPKGTYAARTQPDGGRSGPGDTDLVLYSLRHWLRLVVAGNPSVLLPLFAPDDAVLTATGVGQGIREHRGDLLSQRIGRRHLGYLQAQRERLTGGGKRNRVPNRPELIARHGWDTKYAAHALRLGLQGVEIMETGVLTLPMRAADRASVMAVRRGEVTYEEALARIDAAEARLRRAVDAGRSPLPADPDLDVVSRWSVLWHDMAWGPAPRR